MKKTLLFAVFMVLFYTNNNAQLQFDFYNTEEIFCTSDSSIILAPVNIEMYQTIDDNYDSQIDSSVCISIVNNKLDISQIDHSRPVFFRDKGYKNFEETSLYPNFMYSLQVFLNDGMQNYQFVDSCSTAGCTEVILVHTYPNETGTELIFNENRYNFLINCDVNVCFPTQKMEGGQHIAEAILKIHFTESAVENEYINYPSFNLSEVYWTNLITEDIVISEGFNIGDNTYSVNPYSIFNTESNLFIHASPDYPSSENQFYIDFVLEQNKSSEQNIIIEEENFIGYFFQNFVSIRPGLIEGSDSLRHNLTFNFANEICLSFVELVFGENTNLNFKDGSSFNTYDKESCIQLKRGANMNFDTKFFQYGIKGVGNLGMVENSSINVLPGSNLLFDGKIMLWDLDGDLEDDGAHIYLHPGSSLEFTQNARILDASGLYVYIYMNGGHLDLSLLEAKSRSKIKLIYPDDLPNKNITLYPNPVTDYIFLDYKSPDEVSYRIYNISGKLLKSGMVSRDQNRIEIQEFDNGMYFLSIENKSPLKWIKE